MLLFSHWSTQTGCSTLAKFVAVAVLVEGMTALEGMAFPRGHRQPLRGSTALEGMVFPRGDPQPWRG